MGKVLGIHISYFSTKCILYMNNMTVKKWTKIYYFEMLKVETEHPRAVRRLVKEGDSEAAWSIWKDIQY